MTTSHTTCPECGAKITHAETFTDATNVASRPVEITVHRCPDCGKTWQVIPLVLSEENLAAMRNAGLTREQYEQMKQSMKGI